MAAGVKGPSAIARHLTANGTQITAQAIHLRLKRILAEDEDRAQRLLPWTVRSPEHAQGWVYGAARAYAKWQKGAGLDARELRYARELEEYLNKHDAVLTYDHDRGFLLRNRRPDDGPSGLAAS